MGNQTARRIRAQRGRARSQWGARGIKQIRVPSILIGHVPSVHHKRGAPAVARAPDRPRVRRLTRGGWATKPPAARARQSSGTTAIGADGAAALGKNRAKKPQKPKLERAARNRGRARCRVGVPYDFGPQSQSQTFGPQSQTGSCCVIVCVKSAQNQKNNKRKQQ